METKETETEKVETDKYAKVTLDIDVFKKQYDELVVEGEESILRAESIQKQVKSLKGLAKSSTDFEWKRRKEAYETSRTETEKKKKEYYEIRNKRNALMNACADIFTGIKTKIENYQKECIRIAEANKARIAAESAAAERESKEKEERKLQEAEEAKKPKEPEVQKPPQQNETESKPLEPPIDTTGVTVPKDTQKTVKEGDELIERRIDIEVYDITAFLSSILRGVNGATHELVVINESRITALARKLETKPGDDIIPGVRVKG